MKAAKSSGFVHVYRYLTTVALRIYFGKIEVVGLENIPKDKPFILATNHQNAFLDPHLAGSFCPKPGLHFLTRGDIFNKKTTPLLRLLNMIPIYRIRDGIGSLGKNEETFEICAEIFRQKNAVLIFSEANHGEHHYLRPIKKGTSRLAFHGQREIDEELVVIPCGLNYFSHLMPRRKAIVVFGKPIPVREYLNDFNESEAKGLNNLKTRIAEWMKECLVIPEKTDDYPQKAQEIFSRKNESRTFAELRKQAEGDFSQIELKEKTQSTIRKALIFLFFLPNFLPLLLLSKFLSGIKDKVFWASFKYAFMIFVAPMWWLILVLVSGAFGMWQLGGLLVLASAISFFVRAELRKT